jgi:hypothetical protein
MKYARERFRTRPAQPFSAARAATWIAFESVMLALNADPQRFDTRTQ